MIADILDRIEREHPLHLDTVPYFANFQRHVKLFLYPPDTEPMVLKICEGREAGHEYRALLELRPCAGSFAPEPLYCVEDGTGSALACRLVEHHPMKPSHLRKGRFGSQVIRIFESMVSTNRGCYWREPVPMEFLAKSFERNIRAWGLPVSAADYAGRLAADFFNEWPRIPQHGDMTLYNFGICGRQVVLFDWEDYGIFDLGGLDVATLLYSAGADVDRDPACRSEALFSMADTPLARSCLKAVGASGGALLRYFPFFLLCFLDLKTRLGYGAQIQSNTLEFIRFVFESDLWKPRIQ